MRTTDVGEGDLGGRPVHRPVLGGEGVDRLPEGAVVDAGPEGVPAAPAKRLEDMRSSEEKGVKRRARPGNDRDPPIVLFQLRQPSGWKT